jgi:hypothetical protein
MSEGTEVIVTYFTPLKGSGNKNTIDERRTIVINDNAVVVTGFYTFTRMVETSSGRRDLPCLSPSAYSASSLFAARSAEELKRYRCCKMSGSDPKRTYANTLLVSELAPNGHG